mmetsp:Transcript_52269/g.138053  ORF Transcript_52269/g.138053 Transcript_52269/m.138053 type:complete len:818 (+) Transcript_52269:1136-3589(+)
MEALLHVAVEQDLELLPPVLAERHGVAVRSGPLGLHRRRLPAIECARNGVAAHRDLLVLKLATATGPEEDLLPLRAHLRLVLFRLQLRGGEHRLTEQDHVDVGASEALGRDPGVHVVHGELDAFVHVVALVLGLHVRIDLVQVIVRRYRAPLVAHEDSQERGDACVLEAEAHAGLNGRQAQGRLAVLASQHAQEGVDLHGVGHEGAFRVALDGVDALRGQVGVPEALGHQLLLGRATRRVHGCVQAVGAHDAGRDDPVQGLAVDPDLLAIHCLREALLDDEAAAVAKAVAIRGGVEGEAAARLGEQADALHLRPPDHAEDPVDAARQREVVGDAAALVEHAVRSDVAGAQRGGALRVDGHARALHAEAEAEAVRVDTRRAARGAGDLRDHAEDGGAAAEVDAAPGVHQLLLVVARPVAGLVADLQDHALVRIHAGGLRRGEREEAAVEELEALREGAVPQHVLLPPPRVRIRVVVRLDVPALQRDRGDEVAARHPGRVPGGELPGGAEPSGRAADSDPLLRVEHVVHLARPARRQVADHVAGEGLLLLQLLQARDRPPLQLLHDGDPAGRRGVLLVRRRGVAEEARHEMRLGEREVLVRHHVRPEHDDASRNRGHLEGLGLLVEGLQLQGPLDGPEAEDDHDPGPNEDVQPGRRVVLPEVRGLLAGHACLVDGGVGAGQVVEAQVREHVLNQGRRLRHLVIDHFDKPARRRLVGIQLVEGEHLRRPLGAEQAVHNLLRGLDELARGAELFDLSDGLLDGLVAEVRVDHAEAFRLQVPRHLPTGDVRVGGRVHLHVVERGSHRQRHVAGVAPVPALRA